jgi:hypothetical protein
MRERQAGSLRGVELLTCITENKDIVSAKSGGKEPVGFAFLQMLFCVGIEMNKTKKIRGWLERHMGVPLLDADKLDKK